MKSNGNLKKVECALEDTSLAVGCCAIKAIGQQLLILRQKRNQIEPALSCGVVRHKPFHLSGAIDLAGPQEVLTQKYC